MRVPSCSPPIQERSAKTLPCTFCFSFEQRPWCHVSKPSDTRSARQTLWLRPEQIASLLQVPQFNPGSVQSIHQYRTSAPILRICFCVIPDACMAILDTLPWMNADPWTGPVCMVHRVTLSMRSEAIAPCNCTVHPVRSCNRMSRASSSDGPRKISSSCRQHTALQHSAALSARQVRSFSSNCCRFGEAGTS